MKPLEKNHVIVIGMNPGIISHFREQINSRIVIDWGIHITK